MIKQYFTNAKIPNDAKRLVAISILNVADGNLLKSIKKRICN